MRWSWFIGVVVVAIVFALGRCSAPDPAPLPSAVQHNLERHVAQTAADSATIVLLEADTLAKHHRIQTLTDSASAIDAAAHVSADRADSSAARASASATARDSATYWHVAYVDRTHESDQFQRELLVITSKALLLEKQKTTVSTIGGLYRSEVQLGDVVIQELLPLAELRDRCRLFLGTIKCPTRKQVFVGGVLAGAVGYAIATGRIRIPVSLFGIGRRALASSPLSPRG